VRPAHRGTQIVKGVAANNGHTIAWTISVGKTGFLATIILSMSGNVGEGTVYVRDAADVFQYDVMGGNLLTLAGYSPPASVSFWPPLEIPAGWDIMVYSGAIGLIVKGLVFGWEE